MYSVFYTFFGLPLSQTSALPSCFRGLQMIIEDGYSLQDLSPSLLNIYRSSLDGGELSDHDFPSVSFELLEWILEKRPTLLDLDVRMVFSYSGSGEMPRWFGFEVTMPHQVAFSAQRLPFSSATSSDQDRARTLLALIESAPDSCRMALRQHLAFYSMHGTS